MLLSSHSPTNSHRLAYAPALRTLTTEVPTREIVGGDDERADLQQFIRAPAGRTMFDDGKRLIYEVANGGAFGITQGDGRGDCGRHRDMTLNLGSHPEMT
jgi:hypothetical protein